LVAYVLMSAYMRLCYVLTTISKTYLLLQQGPCESSMLPGQSQINAISGLMFMVEPAHFIGLCWITHVAFPMRECDKDVTKWTCVALHVASTIFVGMWIVTGLAVIILIITVTFFDRNRHSGTRWWEDTLGNQAVEESLRLTNLPDPLREQIVGNLPTTTVPPADGEPCAICFDASPGDEWRILPCGHRFHPQCVDEWLKKQRGSCPTCRQDPTQDPTCNPALPSTPEGNDDNGWGGDRHIEVASMHSNPVASDSLALTVAPQEEEDRDDGAAASISLSSAPEAASMPATDEVATTRPADIAV